MSEFTLNAQPRTDLGKGASRRLRRNANLIPAVIYGANKEATSISLENREVAKLLLNDACYSSILTINLDGKKEDVMMKDLQRHPAKGFVLHADFIRIVAGQKLTALVPVVLLNEEDCVGVKRDGGEIFRPAPEVEITCLPKDLPEAIEVDVANLEVGQTIHLSDIKAPAGVEFVVLLADNDQAVVSVNASRVQAAADEGEEAEGNAEASAEE
ncbi:50S ribosomal protein L25/general stress protein Ctc [Thiopseudomonas denitrificans]|uniref:Large ribosomal subunit protein bL25 n=1 Tax=Thiopseudomonas denitrificans TaxID=1501432 RepID=A0A4R6TZC4_9GAMM|nr:50S ribosomal protein L25/general stress protein Ctc [Thiopseudomonas denitrificans]TDQ38971.1 LSU ribosomal protein L25P [Thiopseudomonas denitrificans]